jgi:hypothetical protein
MSRSSMRGSSIDILRTTDGLCVLKIQPWIWFGGRSQRQCLSTAIVAARGLPQQTAAWVSISHSPSVPAELVSAQGQASRSQLDHQP